MHNVVIVGAGQAGVSVAESLREKGFQGRIQLLGHESEPPYQRPPLSKAYMLSKITRDRLFLHPPDFYESNAIDLRVNHFVHSIDRYNQCVRTTDGIHFSYDQLVLATGARALCPKAWTHLRRAHLIRTLGDIDAFIPTLKGKEHFSSKGKTSTALIIGGGYIGLEAAAVLSQLNVRVTVIEAQSRLLQRVAGKTTAQDLQNLHQAHGVLFETNAQVIELTEDNNHVQAVLHNGDTHKVDYVIIGIGAKPNTEIAESAGLMIDNGIAVNEFGQTSDQHIWAAGDCTSFPFYQPNAHGAQRIRLESVQNACDQGKSVAQNILALARGQTPQSYCPVPWFWSDQFATKLQIAGLNTGYDRIITRIADSHSIAHPSVSYWYYQGNQFLAVDALNAPQSYMVGKRLLSVGQTPPMDKVIDPACNLKTLLKSMV